MQRHITPNDTRIKIGWGFPSSKLRVLSVIPCPAVWSSILPSHDLTPSSQPTILYIFSSSNSSCPRTLIILAKWETSKRHTPLPIRDHQETDFSTTTGGPLPLVKGCFLWPSVVEGGSNISCLRILSELRGLRGLVCQPSRPSARGCVSPPHQFLLNSVDRPTVHSVGKEQRVHAAQTSTNVVKHLNHAWLKL